MLSDMIEEIRRVVNEADDAQQGLEEKKYQIEDFMSTLSDKKDSLEDALGYLQEAQDAMEELENYTLPDAQEIIS